jgi:ABC-type sugar transport system permease subunit
MSRNPYAAPGATVADPPMPPIQRPPLVARALQLLWTSFVLGLIGTFVHEAVATSLEWIITTVFVAVYSGVVVWLIYKIGRGRNWARIVYLILAAISYLMTGLNWRSYYGSYGNHLGWILLDFAGMAAELAALYLLFSRPANAWFRAESEA